MKKRNIKTKIRMKAAARQKNHNISIKKSRKMLQLIKKRSTERRKKMKNSEKKIVKEDGW